MSYATQDLFDVLGPKGRRKSNIAGFVTITVVALILGFIVVQLYKSGQFAAAKWELFTFPLVQREILETTGSTLRAFATGAILALILGVLLLLGRLSPARWVRTSVTWLTETFRAIPLLVLMMLIYYGLPVLGATFVTPFIAVTVGLAIYNGSVFAEIFRAGLNSLPKGQSEAGAAIGLRKGQVLAVILAPQAIRNMLPAIISQLVVALKDTALGFMVTYPELLYLAKFYGTQMQYGSPIIPAAMVMGSIYVALCLALSYVAVRVQKWSSSSGTPKKVKRND
ncbi:amino acid ABC transporter permease [Microterricola pindariensis]|uniref:Amino acid ABC transporter permease n=1 Tax=Microterricola pindariensis TaxID=478010 RepID=A0ABX5AWX9_9MICO|nr:amino acid ABC transporter permease [Microterricola pindariensis]PPL18953.1 amino acid ABC transporter permease [Microterricola pindariensis]